MQKTATAMIAMLLLLGLSAFSTAEHGADDERSANFIGSTTTRHDLNEACAEALDEPECPTRIIYGIISLTCDYDDSSADHAGLYDGIGGVSFCEIPMGATISLQYTNTASVPEALGKVTCPVSFGLGNKQFGVLRGDEPTQFTVPNDCDEDSPAGHAGNTRVKIFNTAASISVAEGSAQFGFSVEGEITLRL